MACVAMAIGLVGRKVGMTQVFDEHGKAVPVTVIQAGPCPVVQRKTTDRDGYEAIQIGFETLAEQEPGDASRAGPLRQGADGVPAVPARDPAAAAAKASSPSVRS